MCTVRSLCAPAMPLASTSCHIFQISLIRDVVANTHEVFWMCNHEKLLQSFASKANIKNSIHAHPHAMNWELSQPSPVDTHNPWTKIIHGDHGPQVKAGKCWIDLEYFDGGWWEEPFDFFKPFWDVACGVDIYCKGNISQTTQCARLSTNPTEIGYILD